jgi:DHA1 family bicyclomycin/chloramphenicol resistance-like MFS transporter
VTRPRRRLIANLLAQLCFGLVAMTLCLPSMPSWRADFGGSAATVQLTFSAFLVTYGVLQLVYGPVSDRRGRRPVLIVGLLVACIASVGAALADSLAMLVAARTLQGAGCAAGMVVGRALVQDLFSGPDRTRVMAWVGMAMGLCPPLGTIVGGQVHEHFGWQANFVLAAAMAAALALAAWRGLPAHAPSAATSATASATASTAQQHWWPAMRSSYARLAREPVFGLYVGILSMSTASFYAFLAGAPLVLGSQGVGPASMGFYIMAVPLAYIVGNYLTSRAVRRLAEPQLMHIGLALAGGGLALVAALAVAGLNHPLAFALPLMLVGLGHGFLMPATLAGTVGVLPALAGAAAAVGGLMQQLMGAVGGYVVGLVEHDGALNLALVMLAFTAVSALSWHGLHRRRGRQLVRG